MKNAKTNNKNTAEKKAKKITAFPKPNAQYEAIRAKLLAPNHTLHNITEAHVHELDTFLACVNLGECRATLIYLQAFFTMYRNNGQHLGINDNIVDGWEELMLLNQFLGNVDWLDKKE